MQGAYDEPDAFNLHGEASTTQGQALRQSHVTHGHPQASRQKQVQLHVGKYTDQHSTMKPCICASATR